MAEPTKGPHTCEAPDCSLTEGNHVILRMFTGAYQFVLCDYHLDVAVKVKNAMIEGHATGPDCAMPGADWYQNADVGASWCICADGAETVEAPAALQPDSDSGDSDE